VCVLGARRAPSTPADEFVQGAFEVMLAVPRVRS
jgi:hypothetical protein